MGPGEPWEVCEQAVVAGQGGKESWRANVSWLQKETEARWGRGGTENQFLPAHSCASGLWGRGQPELWQGSLTVGILGEAEGAMGGRGKYLTPQTGGTSSLNEAGNQRKSVLNQPCQPPR